MESRKVIFILSNSSSQKSIMSEAETLGALKADAAAAGINYNGMVWYEGRTRTELKDDASILPTNIPVPAKGDVPASTTNDLVFMLTTANKKIKSGAKVDRTALFAEIKDKNLGAEVTARFGKNMTQCKTDDLVNFLNEKNIKQANVTSEETKEPETIEVGNIEVQGGCVDVVAREALYNLLDILIDEDALENACEYVEIKEMLSNNPQPITSNQKAENKKEELSKSEIDDLFSWV